MNRYFNYYFVKEVMDYETLENTFRGLPVHIQVYPTPIYDTTLERFVYGMIASQFRISVENMDRFSLVEETGNYLKIGED